MTVTSTITEEGDEQQSKSISNSDDPSHCRSEPPVAAKDMVEVTHAQGRVVYFCFLLLGLGTLLPWNFFITAQSYWDFKLENKTGNGTRTHLQDLYTPLQVCLSQIPNFIFLFINALFSHKIPQRIRLLVSLTLMILLFCITTVFTQVNTNEWQVGFFTLTMIIIILINSAGAVFQGGLFGVAGMFPEKYMTAVVSGQALGGVFASGARIVSLSVGAKDENSAFIYFMIAVIVMIFTLIAYLFMSKTDFYKHYTNCHKAEKGSDDAPQTERTFSNQVQIFKEIWPLGVSVWGVFAVTLGAFPALCVKIISTSEDEIWSKVYFQPVVTFLLFNIGDYIGRQVAGFVMWPRRGSWILYVMVALRVVFIPLFLLCNHNPNSSIPTLFAHDSWYILFMLLFSLSNGYCSSLSMMYGPKIVTEDKAEVASSMMAAMLGLGLLTGGLSSFAFALIS
ncbi:equilibrative nucleoside transporter 1-like isoform X2 [Portunus trituberculatus]|uniref:equilibrative nucleoside transporter 1-like isoform X2 n=1 Tax=Portunus trituberculatus TaxID=210409 RepID=UPI001E1CB87A|nr:equilibrative nucleoside transporter 1-like isoform X2 [Portunus trituberculatus]